MQGFLNTSIKEAFFTLRTVSGLTSNISEILLLLLLEREKKYPRVYHYLGSFHTFLTMLLGSDIVFSSISTDILFMVISRQ
jgi:hypothetical protein